MVEPQARELISEQSDQAIVDAFGAILQEQPGARLFETDHVFPA
jgi:hypothetical protein